MKGNKGIKKLMEVCNLGDKYWFEERKEERKRDFCCREAGLVFKKESSSLSHYWLTHHYSVGQALTSSTLHPMVTFMSRKEM